MVTGQRCLQLEVTCNGPWLFSVSPNHHEDWEDSYLGTTKICSWLESIVCYHLVDHFQVISIENNIFKITSLPRLHSLASPILPAPTHIRIHTHVCIFAAPLQCQTIRSSSAPLMLHFSASLYSSEGTEAQTGWCAQGLDSNPDKLNSSDSKLPHCYRLIHHIWVCISLSALTLF